MKTRKLWRTAQEGWQNFYRDGWLTFATVTVITLAFYVLSATVIIGTVTYVTLKNVQDRVNISVYFNPDVSEESILRVREELQEFEEVKSIDYISREQALREFRAIVADDPIIIQTLDELDENPLNASLIVRAKNPEDYTSITTYVDDKYTDDVARVNHEQNKETIERLSTLIAFVRNVGFSIGGIFIVIAILITFNTVRMSMYSHRREFEIMHLVGASNLYVRMPSVFEGIFYGIAGGVITFALLIVTALSINPFIKNSIPFVVKTSYLQIAGGLFLTLLVVGVLLGMFSSFIAIRRYLEK